MLKVNEVNAFYGDLQALWRVSLQVNDGELVALVGPNGAGKTTTLKVITRLMRQASGEINFDGHDLKKQPAYKVVELAVPQVPQGGRVFTGMTVLENP